MKILLLLICSSFAIIFHNGQIEKCNGIENFIFGMPKDRFKDLTLEFEHGNAQLYTVSPEALKIKDVQIDYIRLSFIKGKLSAIAISTKSGTGEALFNYLKNTYGAPVKNKGQFDWSGKKITITLEPYRYSKDAVVDFYTR